MPIADIAAIIQSVQNGTPDGRQPEKRHDPRWPYRVTQLVAFHAEYEPPTKEMLQAVRCHDISLGGISFYFAGPPPQKHCTMVLGHPPNLIFVRARVVHCQAPHSSEDWVIGCQFIEKAHSMIAHS